MRRLVPQTLSGHGEPREKFLLGRRGAIGQLVAWPGVSCAGGGVRVMLRQVSAVDGMPSCRFYVIDESETSRRSSGSNIRSVSPP